jgi:hypothetical protein
MLCDQRTLLPLLFLAARPNRSYESFISWRIRSEQHDRRLETFDNTDGRRDSMEGVIVWEKYGGSPCTVHWMAYQRFVPAGSDQVWPNSLLSPSVFCC